jgi:hypothetical protein
MQSSGTGHAFALTSLEYDVLCAVVTKFAADLVLFRLAKPTARGEAAALEEVATSTAVMLNDRQAPTQVEELALQAIVESVSTGAAPELFDALCAGDTLAMTPARLRQLVQVIQGKVSGNGYRAAA